jgi:hypothetical protein
MSLITTVAALAGKSTVLVFGAMMLEAGARFLIREFDFQYIGIIGFFWFRLLTTSLV